jgi:hypothetical protein
MKAIEARVGQRFNYTPVPNRRGLYARSGIIISTQSRQGDEAVIVEWDDNLQPQAMNVNDLKLL